MVIGTDNTLYAALKSIPSVEVPSTGPGSEAGRSGEAGAAMGPLSVSGGLDPGHVATAQAAVAASMLRGVRGQIRGFQTSTAEVRVTKEAAGHSARARHPVIALLHGARSSLVYAADSVLSVDADCNLVFRQDKEILARLSSSASGVAGPPSADAAAAQTEEAAEESPEEREQRALNLAMSAAVRYRRGEKTKGG